MLISNSVMFIKPPLSTSCIRKRFKKIVQETEKKKKNISIFFPFCINGNGPDERDAAVKVAAVAKTLYFEVSIGLEETHFTASVQRSMCESSVQQSVFALISNTLLYVSAQCNGASTKTAKPAFLQQCDT